SAMLRQQISVKTAAVAFFVALAAIYAFYWRGLVYQPRGIAPRRGGGGAPRGGGAGGGGRGAGAGGRGGGGGPGAAQRPPPAGGDRGEGEGPPWATRFNGRNALAVAPDGTVFVADSRNHRIRRLAPSGHVSTEAGGGEPGGPGGRADGYPEGVPAAAAQFRYP